MIMSASCFESSYLVRLYEKEFLECGGDPEWLEGGRLRWPTKLANLQEVNFLLAYKPWRLTNAHFEPLLKAGSDSWTTPELFHALTLLILSRQLASLCFASGIDIDVAGVAVPTITSGIDSLSVSGGAPGTGTGAGTTGAGAAVATLGAVQTSPLQSAAPSRSASELNTAVISTADIVTMLKDDHFEEPGSENVSNFQKAGEEVPPARSGSTTQIEAAAHNAMSANRKLFEKYVPHITKHEDFQSKSESYSGMKFSEFCWEIHGFSMVRQFLPGVEEALEKEFDIVQTMSDRKFGHAEGLDTTPFRHGIWYYILCVYGLFADDYNYAYVNKFVPRQLKTHLKRVVHDPSTITKDSTEMGYHRVGLRPEEKLHVNIIAIGARKQAELLYCLRAKS